MGQLGLAEYLNTRDGYSTEMENTPNSDQCNHGRPTYLKLDLEEINKLFGRT